ncbi:MAG: choice-of-anchor D domain-containing protein [Polyangiaceae bacterium]|nr:choice-of-anchor D domain-containing protein [Polyangiaceae bacterium]
MKPATWLSGFWGVLLALGNGCGGNSQSDPSTSGDTTGGDASSSNTGGVSTGAATSGGGGGGADATGGSDPGGALTGGSSPGGAPTGGRNTGGGSTGGTPTATGGRTDTGGSGSGGASAGGSSTGGVLGDTGGSSTGGNDIGTGGVETGGTTTEGGAGGGGGGTPTEAFLELDHSRMDFGTVVLGSTATDTFTLTNRGASTSGIPTISVQSSGLSSAVTISGCDAALAPGESCTLTLGVTPPDLGLFDTFVRIVADPGTDPHLSIYVVGHASAFEISPPAVLELGNVEPGDPRQHRITVTATTPISDLEVLTGWDEVSVVASATTCTDTLAAGDSCVVTVQFLSLDVGWFRVGVGIRAGGDLGQMAGVEITANVTSAEDLAVEPENPPPFEAYFDETTDPIVFTVTNVGAATSGTITSAIVGESASDFAISDTDCTTLAPQETCTVSVVCSPPMSAAGGPREAVVSITDGNTHVPIPLTAQVSFRE